MGPRCPYLDISGCNLRIHVKLIRRVIDAPLLLLLPELLQQQGPLLSLPTPLVPLNDLERLGAGRPNEVCFGAEAPIFKQRRIGGR